MSRTLVVEARPIGHRAFYLSLILNAMEGDELCVLAPPTDSGILEHMKRRGLEPSGHDFIAPESENAFAVIAQVLELCRERHFDRVFFAYMDEFLPSLITQLPQFPCPVSGIWFHPYALDRRYRWLPPLDKRLRQRRAIHHALRHPKAAGDIGRLCFLDSAAVNALARLNPAIPATLLPDPWERMPTMDRAGARRHFGLPEDQVIFLHIGSSEKRKGLADVITAFESLRPGATNKRPVLLRVGENERLKKADRTRLAALVEMDTARVVDGFVSEQEFMEYFAAADWILLPYRNFRFSSGILSNAIAAGRPVIAADHGFIGRTVRETAAGLLFRHRSQAQLARAIRQAMDSNASSFTFRPDALAPANFVAVLKQHLGC